MAVLFLPIWKKAPFLRILLPFAAGIVARYYVALNVAVCWIAIIVCIILFAALPIRIRFQFPWIQGCLINVMLLVFGALVMHYNDTSGIVLPREQSVFAGTLTSTLSEKASSWKAIVELDDPGTEMLVYFRKDSAVMPPGYGCRILFRKRPGEIENIPAFKNFDYKKYCALKHIHWQVFLNPGDYAILQNKRESHVTLFLIAVQRWVVQTLQKYIPGKKEYGLAEALLIGYKEDLDKQLLQQYTNTGVVHVVAISGLHLGLIYALLRYLCIPLGSKKSGKFITSAITVSGLWIFTLLAGGGPSIVRSAVMFTFIVLGECLSKRVSIFNSLAASALVMLCYEPNWLWDLGFQLSYLALTSIVLFMKPVYHLLIPKNKIADAIWKLNAVTIAAQVLTTPVCIFYFHQFPNLFLVTNFIAVPLSGIILSGEILLCAVSFLPAAAIPLGKLLAFAIRFMNGSIEWLGSLSFATTNGIGLSFGQLVVIYLLIFYIAAIRMVRQHG